MFSNNYRIPVDANGEELMQILFIKINVNNYEFKIQDSTPILSRSFHVINLNKISKRMFCTCSMSLNTQICKHGRFLCTKVLRIFGNNNPFFMRRIFLDDEMLMISQKISELDQDIVINNTRPMLYDPLNLNQYSSEESDISENESSIEEIAIHENERNKRKLPISHLLERNINAKTEKNKIFDNDDECSVCFDKLDHSDVIKCDFCNNFIHSECLKKWFETDNTCVFCRKDIKKKIMSMRSSSIYKPNVRIICECGSSILEKSFKNHLMTKKHRMHNIARRQIQN